MSKPDAQVFACLRELVLPNRPDLLKAVDRLETDPRMDSVWPSLTRRTSTRVDQLEALRLIVAAVDKAVFASRLESARQHWAGEKADCLAAVETLTKFFTRFDSATLPKSRGGQEPTAFDEIRQMKDSLVWAAEFFEHFHSDFEEAVRSDLPASRKRGNREMVFIKDLCTGLKASIGRPLQAFVAVATSVVFGLDYEIDEKTVQKACAQEKKSRGTDTPQIQQ
jgi:hypothetical protein